MKCTLRPIAIALLALILTLPGSRCLSEDEERGFLESPPVFLYDEKGIPLTLMSTEIPPAGKLIPGFDSTTISSDEFRVNGENVQPGLDVKQRLYRLNALAGLSNDWGGGISIPWQITEVSGSIGGLPATADFSGLGNLDLFGKRRVWHGTHNDSITLTGGLEFATGKDDGTFDQSNAATNGYYTGYPRRVPLGWQPSTGSLNGFIAAAYGRHQGRLSYMGILAAKLHSSGDEDVKVGNVFVGAANGTYGIGRDIAFSLGLILYAQADDEYPQAPPPGVESDLLAGTTNNGTTLYLTPSIRWKLGSIVIGAGVKYPVVKPDDGMVPDTRGFLIIYPSL